MINLFKRIYLKPDYNLVCSNSQSRIVATDREFEYPIVKDEVVLQLGGILDVYCEKEHLHSLIDNLQDFVTEQVMSKHKTCIIANEEVFHKLLCITLKSFMPNISQRAAHYFYRMMYIGERSIYLTTIAGDDYSGNKKKELFPELNYEEFSTIFDSVEANDLLKELPYEDIPIEFLMLDYARAMVHKQEDQSPVAQVFLDKFMNITLENVIYQLRTARDEILSDRLPMDIFYDNNVDEVDFLKKFSEDSRMRWILDPAMARGSDYGACKKYSLNQFYDMYERVEELTRIKYEEKEALGYIARRDRKGLFLYDASDMKGSFISSEQFVSKVNTTLVNRVYRAIRYEDSQFLDQYVLATR